MAHKMVVHCKKDKYDVYIGRPSKWGNPFTLKREEDRELVLGQYKEWLKTQPQLIEDAKRELKGKVLGCWCAPRLCHGDVLAAIANEYNPENNETLKDFIRIFNNINGKKLGVVGSRVIIGETRIDKDLKYILDNTQLQAIVSGGAAGVDTSAEEFAHDNNLQPIIHHANWRKHGKGAGFIRNAYIARDCDALIAYIKGQSSGTKNTISQVEKLRKPLLIIENI